MIVYEGPKTETKAGREASLTPPSVFVIHTTAGTEE